MLEYMCKELNKKTFIEYSTLYSRKLPYQTSVPVDAKTCVSHLAPFRNGDNLAMKWFHTKVTLTCVEKIHGYRIISDPGRVIRENRNRISGKTMDFSIVVTALNKNERKKVDK